jgi:hypothetical protein
MATKAPKPAAARRVETLQRDEARRENIQTAEYPSVLEKQIQAVLDPYNPTGSARHVAFNTTKTERCATDAHLCHVNWVALDSEWEAEFCRVADKHPRVRAYEKNRDLGLEVPYRYRGRDAQAPARLHRQDPGSRQRARRRRSSEPGLRGRGISRRRREREEEHGGRLPGTGRQPAGQPRPLVLRRVHRRLRHAARSCGQDSRRRSTG